MNRSRPIVFALLFVALVSAAALVGASAGEDVDDVSSIGVDAEQQVSQNAEDEERTTFVVQDGDTAEYLAIPSGDVERSGFERGGLDVAAAVERDAVELRSMHTEKHLESRIDAAETEQERQDVLREVSASIDRRSQLLETRERTAIEGYAAGERYGNETVRTVAIVDAESRALLEVVRTLHEANEATDDPPLTDRELATYRARLEPLSGPVREQIGDTVTDPEQVEVYFEARNADVTLAMLEDDGEWYVREAHLREARLVDGEDRIGFDGAEARFGELYPWVAENNAGLNTFVVGGQPYLHHANVYVVSVAHDHGFRALGDLETYIDGASADVFYETQQQDPEAATTRGTVETADDLQLELNWTRGGWPVSVSVVDLETGEPVDAEITFDGEPVGTTQEGYLWTLGERGTITVQATYQDRTVDAQIVLR